MKIIPFPKSIATHSSPRLHGVAQIRVIGIVGWLVAISLPVVSPALAETMQVRLGDTPDISLADGQGITISFIPSQQIIQKVWLDNPTWVVMDADGCLTGLGVERCQPPGATSLHLRRIKPIPIEGLMPSETSLLTIITRQASGHPQISTFKLVSAQTAKYSIVEVVPSLQPVETLNAALIERGRTVAISWGWMRKGSSLCQKIDRFLDLIKTESISVAAQQSGISVALVQRLNLVGKSETEVKTIDFLQKSGTGNREQGTVDKN